ncbi:MAG: RNA polymerase sigma factor [Planctomycetota bacterium]
MLGRIDHEAEDVVQEAFVRLHRQVAGHGSGSVKHLTTWLFRVTHNLTIDMLRRRSKRRRVPVTAVDPSALSEEQAVKCSARKHGRWPCVNWPNSMTSIDRLCC